MNSSSTEQPDRTGHSAPQRIIVLGGTSFIGRAVTESLVSQGHQVMVVHRGRTEPPDLPPVRHLHADRVDLPRHRDEIADFAPDAAVEVYGMNGRHADAALEALPEDIRLVALSSGDVYRAFESLHTGRQTDALPLTETATLRQTRFVSGPDDENLEVEERYLQRGGTILRLGAVYGPHDYQRRYEFILRRLRAGRRRIPIGSGGFLFSKVYAPDVAAAVGLALANDAVAGQVFNVVESATAPFRLLAQQILDAAGASDTELVRVADESLPSDLALTGAISQHLLLDSNKVRNVLGWRETDPDQALTVSVSWHLDNPPRQSSEDFSADDAALETGGIS